MKNLYPFKPKASLKKSSLFQGVKSALRQETNLENSLGRGLILKTIKAVGGEHSCG
jgi:hypothetical protein